MPDTEPPRTDVGLSLHGSLIDLDVSSADLPPEELAGLFREAGATVASVSPTVAGALAAVGDAPAVAVGSITLAGEVCRVLRAGTGE